MAIATLNRALPLTANVTDNESKRAAFDRLLPSIVDAFATRSFKVLGLCCKAGLLSERELVDIIETSPDAPLRTHTTLQHLRRQSDFWSETLALCESLNLSFLVDEMHAELRKEFIDVAKSAKSEEHGPQEKTPCEKVEAREMQNNQMNEAALELAQSQVNETSNSVTSVVRF